MTEPIGDDGLPSYDELPVDPSRPARSSWGLWGDDDVLGCLNLLTPERVALAAAGVRRGLVFALNLELELPDPPLFGGRAPHEHSVTWLGGEIGHDDTLSGWNTQASSQWDGFRHIRDLTHGFYNGVDDEDHGVHHWARRGLVGRGVLVDVARHLETQGRPLDGGERYEITVDDLDATLAAQGTRLRTGDVLLLRTGWTTWYRGLDAQRRAALPGALQGPGLRAHDGMARYLWDLHIAAVAADIPALEAWPPPLLGGGDGPGAVDDPERVAGLFLHFSLLPLLGLPIGELWDLDALAADCAAEGTYECLLTSAPLNLAGGVASPPNALALR